MDSGIFIAGLAGVTIIGFLIFALTSKAKTEKKLEKSDTPKSALAKDGPTGKTEDRL